MNLPPVLTPGMLDVLRELMNIGVGRAARAIAELSGREVVLRVIDIEEGALTDPRQLADLPGQINVRVSQRFDGGIKGYGFFLLTRNGAVRLAQLVLGQADDDVALAELDQGALLELGNIVVGSAVGMLASELAVEVRYELPQLELRGTKEVGDLFADITPGDPTTALVMGSSLSLRDDVVHGYLVLFFSGTELPALADRLAPLAP